MKKKLISIIISVALITPLFQNIAYAEQNTVPFLNLGELEGSSIISTNIKELKRIRNNISTINLESNTSKDEIEKNIKTLDLYLSELAGVRRNLEDYKRQYSNSQIDIFASELLSFTVETYVIGCRLAQSLMKELIAGNEDAKKIFYSQYANTIYYYFSLGDNQVAYIEVYFNIK